MADSNEQHLSGYELSREWFDFCFENPEKIAPIHTALYFFCIEHCNRLGWKDKFGLPTQMAMDAVGVKNWRTYIKAFTELTEWGFIKVISKSKNQYSATVIAIAKNTKANTNALTKAIHKHGQKQRKSTGKSIAHIDKPNNQEPNNHKNNKTISDFDFSFCSSDFLPALTDWLEYKKQRRETYKTQKSLEALFRSMLKLSGNNSETAKLIVEQSMANNWAGLFELKQFPVPADMKLGCDERIENGRRTYGTGKATIPFDAPPRPSAQYAWNETTKQWIIL